MLLGDLAMSSACRDIRASELTRACATAKLCRVDARSPPLLPTLAVAPDGPMLVARRVQQEVPRVTPGHAHPRGQLVGGSAGLLTVETPEGRWVVGPDQAIWIPPDAPHERQSHGPFSGWSLYLAPVACARLPARACVLGTTALLRTLVERVAEWALDAVLDAAQERLAAVVIDEISGLQPEAVSLPAPQTRGCEG
jgi:quercetin dioxygenase-like cupin family protein